MNDSVKLLVCVCTADSIEANIEASAVDVAYATDHLQQAHRHQVSSDTMTLDFGFRSQIRYVQ